MSVNWQGVFPAVTVQFRPDYSLDVEATKRTMAALIRDRASGLIVNGTVGENGSLDRNEKLKVMEAAVDVARGKVPVIAGLAELSTAAAVAMARDAERAGIDGLMVMPPLIYSAKPHETVAHFRTIAAASRLPIMIYNNPPIYRNDVGVEVLAQLSDCDTIVCIKESSGDTRRLVDIRNRLGDRLVLFVGLDDVVLEGVMLGAVGWVSGMSNAFPMEADALFRLARAGRFAEAMDIYRWFMPLLHLDARPDLVQCIKLAEQLMGRGSELTRPPRLKLEGADRAYVEEIVRQAKATRPRLG